MDGNLTSDGFWSYTYDAENRLIQSSKSGFTITYTYDFMSRRVGMNSNGFNKGYIWDGWNVVADIWLNYGNALGSTFVWGIDVSGTVGGAGGVGGLVMQYYNGRAFLPLNDGQGNIRGYVDSSTGGNAVAWDFTPYGETIYARGGLSGAYGLQDFPFRYQSKMQDADGDLVYYGLRFYHPKLGRFINRDPIGESGGLNLHAFVGNDPANRSDFLGMIQFGIHYNYGSDDFDIVLGGENSPVYGSGIWIARAADRDWEPSPRLAGRTARRSSFPIFSPSWGMQVWAASDDGAANKATQTFADSNREFDDGHGVVVWTIVTEKEIKENDPIPIPGGRHGTTTFVEIRRSADGLGAQGVTIAIAKTAVTTVDGVSFTNEKLSSVNVVLTIQVFYNLDAKGAIQDGGVIAVSINTKYAEFQHVEDFIKWRDEVLIPMLQKKIGDPFDRRNGGAGEEIANLVYDSLIQANAETKEHYDQPGHSHSPAPEGYVPGYGE